MRQQYFILVLAHSLHGRIRRIHIPHRFIYLVLALAVFGSFSLIGMVSSYLRMTLKVANYNSLRKEVDTLRARYQDLQKVADNKQQQLASLQVLASEVSIAYGLKKQLEGPSDIASEGQLLPTYNESLEQYDFLRKSAGFSRLHHVYPKKWQTNVMPSLWPVNGRLLSTFGARMDPFSGERAIHTGVDLSAVVGTAVRATADGVVTHAEYSGAYGKLVVIDHGNGITTMYAHLSRFDVIPGQEVRRGETIGASGGTGRVTSPHLHYEVREGGSPINPYRYLKAQVMSPAPRDFPF